MAIDLKTPALREHFEKRNLSQNNFASKVGISTGYLAQLLNHTRRPSGHVREKLMKATGMTFEELFEFRASRELTAVGSKPRRTQSHQHVDA